MEPTLDERDQAYIDNAMRNRARQANHPYVGDWVIFNDGTERRVSYNWPSGVQTSNDGRFYLMGSGHMSFSGALQGITPYETFADTGITRPGAAWVFHHNVRQAHNGVDFHADVKVWFADCAATP